MRFAPSTISSAIRSRGSESFRMRCSRASASSTTRCSRSISTLVFSILSKCAGAWRPLISKATCRSIPPRLHSPNHRLARIVRGIYWLRMPGYVRENKLQHTRPLPDVFWTGETEMACVRAAVRQTIEEAYAHHIQRLMVTGNYALLIGVDRESARMYLMVYATLTSGSSCRTHSA